MKADQESLKETPLTYLLRLLSEKFTLLGPQHHCKQYFELFCELIDHHFSKKNIQGLSDSKPSETEVFNPEKLLIHIIDKIKEYNQMATEAGIDSDAATANDSNNLTN